MHNYILLIHGGMTGAFLGMMVAGYMQADWFWLTVFGSFGPSCILASHLMKKYGKH